MHDCPLFCVFKSFWYEQVELMSRDEQSVLVVSYAELKYCLDAAFAEVMNAAGADRQNIPFTGA